MTAAVDTVRDRLGKPVDGHIRDVVVALNLLSLSTLQSCERHVNLKGHGLPAPWVDFVDDRSVLRRVQGLIDQFYSESAAADDDLRLVLERDRLGNGGGFRALEAVRINLAAGGYTPAQIEALRLQLTLRQSEMQRFAMFLRTCVLEVALTA